MGELRVIALHLRVEGRVQGVGFRWFVRERARRWGVAGWVRNMPDGSVRLAARGHPDAVGGLVGDVERGPDGSWVTDVIELSADADSQYPDPFAIIR